MKFSLYLLTLLVIPTSFLQAQGNAAPRPNILFVFVDDMGWGDLGLNFQNKKSGKKHATPELDRMALEGARLLRHYCPAPVCAPSRGSLLSGLHQGHANVRDNQFDKALADNHTLATVLSSGGYRSVLVGKYGLQGKVNKGSGSPADWSAYPTKRGFEEFYGSVRHRDGHHHYPANAWPMGNSEGHRTPKELWHNDKEVSGDLDKCFSIDLFTAFAKQWITDHHERSPEQPFFMYLAHDTPHAALQLATGPYPEGRGAKGGLQWVGEKGKMINTATGEIDSYVHPDYRDQGWSDVEQRFASMVRRIDNGVGDLLQLLRELGIADNTLVVFTSDNGPHSESYITDTNYAPTSFQSYGPLDGMKRDVWEGGIRVPTLAWWPKAIPKGTEDHQPSQFHDWMATFAEVAGVPVPALSDGVSLVPQLTGKGTVQPSTVYIEYVQNGRTPKYEDYAKERRGRRRGQMQALFMDGYKGIRTDIKDPQADFEIYDVRADPSERKNLLGTDEKFSQLNQRLKERVLRIRRPDLQAARPYDKLPVPAMETPVKPGISWKILEGSFPWVPRLDDSKAAKIQPASTLTSTLPARSTSICRAFLKVSKEGNYEFHLVTKAKAVVKVHDANLIDADFGYQGDGRSASIRLSAGLHPLTIWATTQGESAEFSLEWTLDGNQMAIPAEALYQAH